MLAYRSQIARSSGQIASRVARLNRSLVASHLHLDFTLSAVTSFPNMETLCQIWKSLVILLVDKTC